MCEYIDKIFFFDNTRGEKMLGFLHTPKINNKDLGIVYCHPFAEEKNRSHAISVKTARALAAQGYPVLRFDLSGCGDSEGEWEKASIDDWIEDIASAVTYLKNSTPVTNIALWGLRLGGGLAYLYAKKHKEISLLILWQPVFDFNSYIRQFLRQRISAILTSDEKEKVSVDSLIAEINSCGRVEINGYTITRNLYNSFQATGSILLNSHVNCSLRIASISLMDSAPIALINLIDKLAGTSKELLFEHVKVEPFWDRNWRWESPELYRLTVDWLNHYSARV